MANTENLSLPKLVHREKMI